MKHGMYRAWGKRAFDLVLVIPGLIVISPILLVVTIASAINLGFPVLFRQGRSGYKGRSFNVLKYRSMRNDVGPDGQLLPDDQRLTKYGKLLRATSLDELPQLWSVLKGEMSLIGPRPLYSRYLDRYSPEQRRRLDVLPGITGWSQVNGRNSISWEDKFALDVWYVDNMSLGLDIKIILMTLQKVFKRSGISAEGHATMYEFMGTETQSADKDEAARS